MFIGEPLMSIARKQERPHDPIHSKNFCLQHLSAVVDKHLKGDDIKLYKDASTQPLLPSSATPVPTQLPARLYVRG
jgi:hypothetical protein